MKCPRCNGKGQEYKSNTWEHPCSGSTMGSSGYTWCSLCDGTGKVTHVRSAKPTYTCSKCNGTGTIKKDIFETYPTGRKIHKGYTTEKCLDCSGSGKITGNKVDYYKPDYKKDGCFITTATCNFLGISNSESVLNDFRKFRDYWLLNQPNGSDYIEHYYSISPKIIDKIENSKNKDFIYNTLWNTFLDIAHDNILNEKNNEAFQKYLNMILWLCDDELY